MAEVTIKIVDKVDEEDGVPGLHISIEFEPEVKRGVALTPAQRLGMEVSQALAKNGGVSDEVADAMDLSGGKDQFTDVT
jgi:hypothetical protein